MRPYNPISTASQSCNEALRYAQLSTIHWTTGPSPRPTSTSRRRGGDQATYAVGLHGRGLAAGRDLHLPCFSGLGSRQRNLHSSRRRVSVIGRFGTRLTCVYSAPRLGTRLKASNYCPLCPHC